MTMIIASSAADILPSIDVNLTMVCHKLAHPEDGEGWPAQKLDTAVGEYLKFMALCKAYPHEVVVPCKLVDELWHAHILDTRAYRIDCERIFGFFYDHFPYFGMRDERDAEDLRGAYDRTLELYALNFGDPPIDTWWRVDGARCRTQCKPVKCR
jgi:hypothetical protein